MSLPLSPVLAKSFQDLRFRGWNFSPSYWVQAGSRSEGRLIELAVLLPHEKIEAIGFKAFGDAYTIGILSWVCSQVFGQTWDSLSKLSLPAMVGELQIPSHKVSAAVLIEECIQKLMEKKTCVKTKN